MSDARRLKGYEQARAHWGVETAEVLMALVVPAGQDMATKADIDAAVVALSARMSRLDARMDGIDTRMKGLATKEYILTMLLVTQVPIYLGIIGLYFTGS